MVNIKYLYVDRETNQKTEREKERKVGDRKKRGAQKVEKEKLLFQAENLSNKTTRTAKPTTTTTP